MIDAGLLVFVLAGILFGTAAGLIPGIGLTATMAAVGVFFVTDNALDILIFYIGMLCASQYAGSITAITLGIPGESSSTPAVREGHVLFTQGHGNLAIGTTAISSFAGSIISMLIFFSLLPFLKDLFILWNANVQTMILSLAVILIVMVSDNRWYVSLFFVLLGASFGLTGVNYAVGFEWSTFDQPWLYNGIPLLPFLMGVFVLPELIKGFSLINPQQQVSTVSYSVNVRQNFIEVYKHRWVIVYSSIIGFVSGLIPNLTTRLASNLSWITQKTVIHKTKGYTPGDISCLISAETSNNAATFSVLLPLILLGMPITTSEVVVYEYMMAAKNSLNLEFILAHADQLMIMFLLANLICLIIAWPLANTMLKIYQIPKKFLLMLLAGLMIFPVIFEGYQQGLLLLYLMFFLFFTLLGLILRKTDAVPMVFAFLISHHLVEGYWVVFQKLF
jgi:putative tricarboxylic transport membrane protein